MIFKYEIRALFSQASLIFLFFFCAYYSAVFASDSCDPHAFSTPPTERHASDSDKGKIEFLNVPSPRRGIFTAKPNLLVTSGPITESQFFARMGFIPKVQTVEESADLMGVRVEVKRTLSYEVADKSKKPISHFRPSELMEFANKVSKEHGFEPFYGSEIWDLMKEEPDSGSDEVYRSRPLEMVEWKKLDKLWKKQLKDSKYGFHIPTTTEVEWIRLFLEEKNPEKAQKIYSEQPSAQIILRNILDNYGSEDPLRVSDELQKSSSNGVEHYFFAVYPPNTFCNSFPCYRRNQFWERILYDDFLESKHEIRFSYIWDRSEERRVGKD